jgi:hypothetical protein
MLLPLPLLHCLFFMSPTQPPLVSQEKTIWEKPFICLMLQQNSTGGVSNSQSELNTWLYSQERGVARASAPIMEQPFMHMKDCVCTNHRHPPGPVGEGPPLTCVKYGLQFTKASLPYSAAFLGRHRLSRAVMTGACLHPWL